MIDSLFGRIASKLVFWLVIFCSSLTLIGTAGQLYLDYKESINQISRGMVEATLPQLNTVSERVVANDDTAINRLLSELIENSGVAYAAVSVNDEVAWEKGSKISGNHLCTIFPLNNLASLPGGSSSLEVVADLEPLKMKFFKQFLHMLIGNGMKIFVVAAFVFLMFQYLVTRHLETIAEQLRDQEPSRPYKPISLGRSDRSYDDELEQVVSGFNTLQKRARDAYESLEKNEERLLLFFDSTEEAILGVDRAYKCTFANDAALKMLGLETYGQIIGESLYDLVPHFANEDKSDSEINVVERSMVEARALHYDDGFIVISGGARIYVSLRSYPVFQNGEVSGALVFINDNSETRQLRRESELLAEAVKQIPVMITIAGTDSRIQYINPGAERLIGYTQKEMIGESFYKFPELVRPDGDIHYEEIESLVKEGKQWEGIVEITSRTGTPLKFHSMFFPILNEKGKIVNIISVSREVSYEIKLQNELMNAKKMEAVGRLSASFAHEFGNPLFGVSAVLKDLIERVEFSAEDGSLIKLAYLETKRMRRMVRDFQQLHRNSVSDDELLTVADVIRKVIQDAEPLMISHGVEHRVSIIKEAETLTIDGGKLAMALRNVVLNGIESMTANGGKLELSTSLDDRYLTVTVGDAGVGIKEEYHDMIFEPFFSTKPEVEGAGLGLSVAYGTMISLGEALPSQPRRAGAPRSMS